VKLTLSPVLGLGRVYWRLDKSSNTEFLSFDMIQILFPAALAGKRVRFLANLAEIGFSPALFIRSRTQLRVPVPARFKQEQLRPMANPQAKTCIVEQT
jgi:hypothetical protein